MNEADRKVNRRKFIAVSSAAVASPLLFNLANIHGAKAAAKLGGKTGKIYFITNKCIGCHACKVFCPEKAIFFGERKMVIDQEKCVQCGTCFQECPICVISEVNI